MSDNTDVAVAKNDIEHIKNALASIKKTGEETRAQAFRTNGRVSKIETRHEEEDKQNYPEKIESFLKFKIQVLAICTVVPLLVSGATMTVFKLAFDSYIETKTVAAIETVLAGYEFNITE